MSDTFLIVPFTMLLLSPVFVGIGFTQWYHSLPDPPIENFTQKRRDALNAFALLRFGHRIIIWLAPKLTAVYSAEKIADLDLHLRRGGRPLDLVALEYLAIRVSLAVAFGVIGMVYGTLIFGIGGVMLGIISAVVGYFLPNIITNEIVNTRLTRLVHKLPYAIDVLALCLGSGATFVGAVEELVREPSDEPLDQEFRIFLTELRLGKTRREALQNLAERCGIELLDNVVLAIIQGEEQGIPVSEVLKRQSAHIRKIRIEQADEQANKASTKILFPTMIVVAATLLLLFGSFIVKLIRGTAFTT